MLSPDMSDPILLFFLRPDIEAGDTSAFLRRFAPSALPKGPKLPKMMGTLSFLVDGYNDDPEEIYSIQAVRDFYARLHAKWPYWFFFCDLRNESLQMITACLLKNVVGHKTIGAPDAHLRLDPMELVGFIFAGFAPMNEMCDHANMSEFDIWKRTKAIFEYFNLAFDAPPPR